MPKNSTGFLNNIRLTMPLFCDIIKPEFGLVGEYMRVHIPTGSDLLLFTVTHLDYLNGITTYDAVKQLRHDREDVLTVIEL
ncbi:MAG: hypothetical protein ACD_41C00074G0005 [uncultured bacterium]|nr:MAG: hypothetical protein ACD_41C00074G0005 [uncultured bacterium]